VVKRLKIIACIIAAKITNRELKIKRGIQEIPNDDKTESSMSSPKILLRKRKDRLIGLIN
jgi:hypothetical protein